MVTKAQLVNEQYNQTQSNFVSLQQRLNDALTFSPIFVPTLTAVVDEFKRRTKAQEWTSFSDLKLCQAIQVPMDRVLIDTTMQRQLSLRHVLNILQFFRVTMVMAIQVYEDENKPGYYIAWDGQHTAIALYVILTKVFGERTANAMIPVVVYNVKHKLEIRRNFILLNGDAKERLDFIDTYKQMVYGVKVDGSDDPEWVDTATKNDYLAAVGLFATHRKFGDENEPGAFSLLADTLMSDSAKHRKHPDVTRMFAQYWSYLNVERPVDAKEARQLYEYFNLCYEQKITVDEKYLLDFVAFTKEYFDADFSPNGPFWDKVKMSYENWFARSNPETYNEFGVRGFTSEMRTGIPFLISQVKKSTKLKTPNYSANNGFTPAKEDLWK
jgi:hypothetical protein